MSESNELKHISEDIVIEVFGIQVCYDIDKGYFFHDEHGELIVLGTLNEVYNCFILKGFRQ